MMKSISIVLVAVGLIAGVGALSRRDFTVRTERGPVVLKNVMPKTSGGDDASLVGDEKPVLDVVSKIVGGRRTRSFMKFPQIVALIAVYSTGGYSSFCSGSIIDKRVVLSAAHCFHKMDPSVKYVACSGTVDIYQDLDRLKCGKVLDAWIPNKYENGKFFNGYDIAVLRLASDVTGPHAKRVKVSFTKPKNGIKAFTAGFGTTNYEMFSDGRMRYAPATVLLNEGECKPLSESGLGGDSDLICAKSKKATTCSGDSGGPLLVKTGEQGKKRDYIVVGSLSFGIEGCLKSSESVYSSLYDKSHARIFRALVKRAGGTFLKAEYPKQ